MNLPNDEEAVEMLNTDPPAEDESSDQTALENDSSNAAEDVTPEAVDNTPEDDGEEVESIEAEETPEEPENISAETQAEGEDSTSNEAIAESTESEIELPEIIVEEDVKSEPEPEIEDEIDPQLVDESKTEESDGDQKTNTMQTHEEDGREWYVVHCYSGYENKVRHNLEQRIESMGMKSEIFDVVVPTEEEVEVKDGKRRTVERRVFPGYILVNMILTEESWYVVRNTPGVTSFVGMGNEPVPLRPEEVSRIIKRMEADAPRIKVTFKQGERVRIVDGPFNDFRGTVDEIDMERAKVRVMVNFFGRETPVELDFLQVEKS